MRRSLCFYIAALAGTLMAGNLLNVSLPSSQSTSSSNSSNLDYSNIPKRRFLIQTAERLAHLLDLPATQEWVAFTIFPEEVTRTRLVVVDGTNTAGEAHVRFLFDFKSSALVSISAAPPEREDRDQARPVVSLAECRAITTAYMATIGDTVGGAWHRKSEQDYLKGVYFSEWSAHSASAYAAIDRNTGKLLYLRMRPGDPMDPTQFHEGNPSFSNRIRRSLQDPGMIKSTDAPTGAKSVPPNTEG